MAHPQPRCTDRAPAYPRVLDELAPAGCHVVEQYANKPIEWTDAVTTLFGNDGTS